MTEHRPNWLQNVLWFYSAWFRYGGLLIAVLAGCMFIVTAVRVIHDGYVIVEGGASTEWRDFAIAFGIPISGVAAGIGLFLLVPKVKAAAK